MDISYKVTGELIQVENIMVDFVAKGYIAYVENNVLPCYIGFTECNGSLVPAYIFTENYIDSDGTFYPCKMIEL